jgi:cell pole-organizing protein PopZ
MGDLSAEPSMEDILASIKRVIKEGESPAQRRPAARPREPEVLELNEPMAHAPQPSATPAPVTPPPAPAGHEDDRFAEAAAVAARADDAAAGFAPAAAAAPAMSSATVEATRGALNNLSRLVVKPEAEGDGTLEGLVREMLRPMLGEWLDRNLPALVEQLVAREIAKITAGHA